MLLAHYVKPPYVPEHLDIFVESMLSTRLGDDYYPGTSRPVPEWPMIAQTLGVLLGYAAAGGRFREVVIDDAGHGPHLDQPERFGAELREHLAAG